MQRLGGQTISTVLIGQNLLFAAPGDDTVGGFYTGWGFDYLTGDGFGVFVAAEGSVMSDKSMLRNGPRRGARSTSQTSASDRCAFVFKWA